MNDSTAAHIVLGADDNYALPLTTTIFSIIKNASPETSLQFHILDGGIADKNIKRFKKVFKKHGKHHYINWIHPDLSKLNELSTPGRPPSIYLPILIPSLLPEYCKKAVFLDCDMIIESDISKLADIGMDGSPIMAVRDYLIQICSDREGVAAYRELVHHPFIIHYLSPSKPWNHTCMHPHTNRFLYYLKDSGWFGLLGWQIWWRRYQARRLLWLLTDLKENFKQIKPLLKD